MNGMRDGRRATSSGNLSGHSNGASAWVKPEAGPKVERGLSRSISDSKESKKEPQKRKHVAHASKEPDYANSKSSVEKVLIFCAILSLLVILMLWDMRQVQQMSEIIHNDKTGLWTRMNNAQIKEWYSPLDICMMKLDDSETDVEFYRNSNCSSLAGFSESAPSPLYCNIGSSIGNKPCYPPLYSKTFFRSVLKDEEMGDPHSRRLRTALRHLAAMRRPVVFVGDGLSKQNQDAMICEIMRTDSVSIVGHYSDTAANYTIQWKNSHLRLNVLYFQLTRVREATVLTKKSKFRILESGAMNRNRRQLRNRNLQGVASPQEVAAAKASQAAVAAQSAAQAAAAGNPSPAMTGSTKLQPKQNPKYGLKQSPKLAAKQQQPLAGAQKTAAKKQPSLPTRAGSSNVNSNTPELAGPYTPGLQLQPKYPIKPLPTATNSIDAIGSSRGMNTEVFDGAANLTSGARNHSSSHRVLTFDKIKKYVWRVVEENNNTGIVLIANVGVYYNSREMFRVDIPLLLSWMDEISRESNSTVFYRETAAQHYNHTSSGYYDSEYDERPFNNGSCVPIADSTPEFDWRNTDVRHVLENDGYDQIHMIPFKDITQPLHNMHPGGRNGETDCTHFCFFPQMWQIVWLQMYSAMNSTIEAAAMKHPGR